MKPTKEMLDAFANALQLSIKTKIIEIVPTTDDEILISFDKKPSDDPNLFKFLSVFDGGWSDNSRTYKISNTSQADWPALKLFLQVTRMNDGNISKWIETNEAALKIAAKMGIQPDQKNPKNVQHVARIVFQKVKKEGITLRKLAAMTGLTQSALCNFKAGGDIKISNLVKIANALKLKLKITE